MPKQSKARDKNNQAQAYMQSYDIPFNEEQEMFMEKLLILFKIKKKAFTRQSSATT